MTKHINKQNDTRYTQTNLAQQGGALLVALILIFMLSIMGVSSMRGSTLEKRMASNSIEAATTFQGAESANEMAINNNANMTKAINIANVEAVNQGILNPLAKVEVEFDLRQQINMESKATLMYIGDAPAYGYSTGNGSNNFVAYMFVIESDAEVKSIRAKKAVMQGAYRIAPAR